MYLNKKKYVGWNWDHRREQLEDELKFVPDLSAFGIDSHKVTAIEEQVCYWRKANAIHNWFVKNVQGGVDDCSKQSMVTKKHISELLTIIGGVLQFPEMAEQELPTASGFFFGSTDYDAYYWQDLRDTKKMLEEVYKNWDEDADYYYQSSW